MSNFNTDVDLALSLVASVDRIIRDGSSFSAVQRQVTRHLEGALELLLHPPVVIPAAPLPGLLPSWCHDWSQDPWFLVVSADVAARILADGYRVGRRHGVPCQTSARRAWAVWDRKCPFECGILLAVVGLPHGTGIRPARLGGYNLRLALLPPECLQVCP